MHGGSCRWAAGLRWLSAGGLRRRTGPRGLGAGGRSSLLAGGYGGEGRGRVNGGGRRARTREGDDGKGAREERHCGTSPGRELCNRSLRTPPPLLPVRPAWRGEPGGPTVHQRGGRSRQILNARRNTRNRAARDRAGIRNARHRDARSRQVGDRYARHRHTWCGRPQRHGQRGVERPEAPGRPRIGRRRQKAARPRHGGPRGRRGPLGGAGVGRDDGKR